MTAFRIEGWQAWAPGLTDAAAWQTWVAAPRAVADDGTLQPDCAFLPPLQRRRLSRMARMVFNTAWPLCAAGEELPFVFGSHYGETTRIWQLLGNIAAGEPLSPTAFGLSVHNAIAGQWSILRGQHGESTAIAGAADTFEHAVLEGVLQLAAGAPAALVVVAEELPPAAYAPWVRDVPFSHALALRLGHGDDWRLELSHRAEEPPCAWPHALDFLRAMLQAQTGIHHACEGRRWTWLRTH